jgi:hypothetical protein
MLGMMALAVLAGVFVVRRGRTSKPAPELAPVGASTPTPAEPSTAQVLHDLQAQLAQPTPPDAKDVAPDAEAPKLSRKERREQQAALELELEQAEDERKKAEALRIAATIYKPPRKRGRPKKNPPPVAPRDAAA